MNNLKVTKEELEAELVAIIDVLIIKNESYGDAALNPVSVFSKLSAKERLCVRIDDKLSRIKNKKSFAGDDDLLDLIRYLILLRLALEDSEDDTKDRLLEYDDLIISLEKEAGLFNEFIESSCQNTFFYIEDKYHVTFLLMVVNEGFSTMLEDKFKNINDLISSLILYKVLLQKSDHE